MTRLSDNPDLEREEPGQDQCDVEVVHADAVRAARLRLPIETRLERSVEVASLLANPTRLKILIALAPRNGETDPRLCVCDLATVIAASDTQTSHQLRALRLAGLVRQRRENRLMFYTLAADPTLRACLAALSGGTGGSER